MDWVPSVAVLVFQMPLVKLDEFSNTTPGRPSQVMGILPPDGAPAAKYPKLGSTMFVLVIPGLG